MYDRHIYSGVLRIHSAKLINLQDELGIRTANSSAIELLRLMGYQRPVAAAKQRLRQVLEDPELGLERGGFDFRYSAEEFVKALCEVVGIAPADYQPAVAAILQRLSEDRMAFKPYLFVDTDFVRRNEPIHALAFSEGERYVHFDGGFWRKPLAEQVELARQRVCEHMAETDGDLGIWGQIQRYHFFYAPEQSVEIATDGQVLADRDDIRPSRATMDNGMETVIKFGAEGNEPDQM